MAITPYLYYQDVDRALAFLAEAFGFRPFGDRKRGPDGKTIHAAMKLGGHVIMMGRPLTAYRNPRQLGQTTQCLYINVANIDKHFQRAREAGAVIQEPPADAEYGHRRYGAADPEGHVWYFARALPRRRPAKRTGKP